jgi:PAT family beta-lactamase induction signal transducer AmpG
VLDVRFSRRWYAVTTASAAAALLVVALLNLDHLAWVEGLLLTGYFCANLYQSALGGWLASITTMEEENRLSVWVNIGNLGGGGAMAVGTGELVRHLSPMTAALLLGAVLLLPTSVFPWMPAPGPDRRLARESFRQFFGEVLRLVKRREVLIAIVLFMAPAATFSLTNFLSGIGKGRSVSSMCSLSPLMLRIRKTRTCSSITCCVPMWPPKTPMRSNTPRASWARCRVG